MTEEEAKTKWCPHVRSMGDDACSSAAGNRWQTDHDDEPNLFDAGNACLGSVCMQWRWGGILADGTSYWTDTAADTARNATQKAGEQRLGYCGLAGKP